MSSYRVADTTEDEDQSAVSDADNMDSSGYSTDAQDLKGPDPKCPACLTAACCCHCCYVFLFLAYLVIFPLWCKWLLTAPMPFNYWGQEYADFPRMPLYQSREVIVRDPDGQIRQNPPEIDISEIPHEQSACNYSCAMDLHGYKTSEMNFHVSLRLNKSDLLESAHSVYPVLLASEDFKHWMLVGDRRNAQPRPFFNDVSSDTGLVYASTQDACSRPPGEGESFTDSGSYFLACVTWSPGSLEALEKAEEVTNEELGEYCSAVGGACGWPCSSGIDPSRLQGCDREGVIEDFVLKAILPEKTSPSSVHLEACEDPSGKCTTSIEDMPHWKCHKCVIKPMSEEDERRRRLQGVDFGDMDDAGDDDDESDEGVTKVYTSLPRFKVRLDNAEVPEGTDIMSKPRAFIFTAPTTAGPWKKIYDKVDPNSEMAPPIPVGSKAPEVVASVAESEVRAMSLQQTNQLTMEPFSCYGKRGPLYLVACAINQSTYDDSSQWKLNKENRFEPGQKVMPPPFNDRCIAVSGRCGFACERGRSENMPHCLEDGYINMTSLVGDIPIQYNRKTPVFCFVYVLLFGFAVKTIMLCPGIFVPYRRCHFYDPEMTRQLRYILVVGVTGGGDEGKGTMIRNTVGMVSGLPPECKCRFTVCNNEEGHRAEMLVCWRKFCNVLAAVPNFGGLSYEENVRRLTQVWCEETKKLSLAKVGAKVKELDPSVLDRLSGKTTLKALRKESAWANFPPAAMAKLDAAVEELHADLGTNYNKFSQLTPHHDFVEDWTPPDPNSTALRMHFTSRAKPHEDPRNMMVQHVAVGTWYYKVGPHHKPSQWLELRKNCREMVYSELDDDSDRKVPLRSSHGKAGGLNFVDNYISIVNDRPENRYYEQLENGQLVESEQNTAPSLYAIADARHQYQPDFMISCVPCFFKENGKLNERVAFTQAPQHYPEYQDKNDYLDNNNAQFFRLNAMIRNCCGGVSSCGTNGMWQIPDRDHDTIWQFRRKRVRDRDHKKRKELIEREQFHTSCKIEDTASSLDRVLVGEYSHFVNRKLSFGMSKSPEGFLGAQQRWVEGAVTLCLQWVTQNADAHGQAKANGPLLWCVIVAFGLYLYALLRLVTVQYTGSVFVNMGILSAESLERLKEQITPGVAQFFDWLLIFRGGHSNNSYDYDVYVEMTIQFIIWLVTCVVMFTVLWIITNFCRCCQRCCTFPYEMKWWGRLVISFDNLTYWVWFWTSFFWIGFNVFLALKPSTFHFNNVGMMSFMLASTFLNYALLITNSMRFAIMESVDANEIAFLSMDNIWRANQLFFILGPIQGFSVFTGTKNFVNYLLYGQDIGGWSGGDLTQVSINIVKYWTTILIFACISCWVYLFVSHPTADEFQSRMPGCIIFTFIALDVLHPCVYLWTVTNQITEEEVGKMSFLQKLMSVAWWKRLLSILILNEATTNILRYVFPAYMFCLPLLVFFNAYFGVSGAFALVAVSAAH